MNNKFLGKKAIQNKFGKYQYRGKRYKNMNLSMT